jgi:serine/threonine protein kinase
MEQLRKKRYAGRGGGDKYYIDCSRYAENSDSLEMRTLIKNTKTHNVTILKAVATDETIKKKNRHIVVKISRTKDDKTKEFMAVKEYRIGKAVEKISGFIKYICLFGCYDVTNDKFESLEAGETPVAVTTKICDAVDKREEKWKYVLVMPYIRGGSLENSNWTRENTDMLKNLIIHTVLSLAVAFEKVGFVHNDLHWGNILFTETKMTEVTYKLEKTETISVPTMGYKVVIMDFEKAVLGEKNPVLFWDNLQTFCRKVAGLKNENNESVDWENENIIAVLRSYKKHKMSVENVVEIVELIENSTVDFVDIRPTIRYNPNVI